MENNNNIPALYTEEQLMARLKFFIGICLSLTLFGIVFVVLYSLIFVTQPLNAISPIDQKFFELIVPIATFLTGTLSGIMLAGNNPDAQKAALEAANKGWDRPPAPTPKGSSNGFSTPTTPSFSAPAGNFGAGSFGATASAPGFGPSAESSPAPSSFGSPFGQAAPAAVGISSTGKTMPAQPDHPEI